MVDNTQYQDFINRPPNREPILDTGGQEQGYVDMDPMAQLTQLVMQHEKLEPFQTPFKITSPGMRKWTSMYDDTSKIGLNPNAKKSKGREGFLYLKRQEDLVPAISEQFRRYASNPRNYKLPMNPTVEDAVRKFDQTGAEGKLRFLQESGLDIKQPLVNLF